MQRNNTSLLFIIIPTIFVIVGILFFPLNQSKNTEDILLILNFVGLFLLLIGYFLSKNPSKQIIKIIGWVFVSFAWSTQINSLYYGEQGDLVNAFFCAAGIFVLFYIAYHEWLTIIKKDEVKCLNWIAGAAAIAGIIYFGIDSYEPLQLWLRETVAAQSAMALELFVDNVEQYGVTINWQGAPISIIFACTAVQSMVLFVGIILPLQNVSFKKKLIGLGITVLPVYFLNLFRNALVIYLTGAFGNDFFSIAHNVIAKILGLIALVILLLIVTKIIPEVFDQILCISDLYKRNGPIEKFIKKKIFRK